MMVNIIRYFKKYNIIKKVLSINIIMFLLVIVFFIYNNFYVKDKLKIQIKRSNEVYLINFKNNFEQTFKNLNTFIYNLNYEKKINSLSVSSYYSKTEMDMIYQLKSEFYQGKISLNFVDEIYLKLDRINKVISSSGVSDINVFTNLQDGQFDNSIIKSCSIREPFLINKNNYIYYMYKLNEESCLILKLSKEKILKYIQTFSEPLKNEIVICNNDNGLIISTIPIDYKKLKLEEISINDEVYKIIKSKNNKQLLNYYVLYHSSSIGDRLTYINLYTIIILSLFIIIIVIAGLINLKYLSPIKNVMEQLKCEGDLNNYYNELNFIESAVINLKDKNRNMNLQLKEDTKIIENNELINYILFGEKNAFEHNKYLHIKGSFVVLFVIIENDKGEKIEKIFEEFEDQVIEKYKYKKIVHIIRPNIYFVFSDNLIDLKQNVSDFFNKQVENNLFCIVSISNIYSDVNDIKKAYEVSVVNAKTTVIKINKKIYITDHEINIKNMDFTLCDEEKLLNNVINGNTKYIKDFFDISLIGKINNSSYISVKQVYNHLINSVYIVFNKNKGIRKFFSEDELETLTVAYNIFFIHERLKSIYISITNYYGRQQDKAIDKIIKFIEENYMRDIYLDMIAEYVKLSPNYLTVYFKDNIGVTVKQYIDHYRMEKAKEIIIHNKNINMTEVSIQVGINSMVTFIRLFKKYNGITPGQYKKSIN